VTVVPGANLLMMVVVMVVGGSRGGQGQRRNGQKAGE